MSQFRCPHCKAEKYSKQNLIDHLKLYPSHAHSLKGFVAPSADQNLSSLHYGSDDTMLNLLLAEAIVNAVDSYQPSYDSSPSYDPSPSYTSDTSSSSDSSSSYCDNSSSSSDSSCSSSSDF